MAAGPFRMPKPGDDQGPCERACKHAGCASMVKMAATECHYCHGVIDYEALFYALDGDDLAHAECHEIETAPAPTKRSAG